MIILFIGCVTLQTIVFLKILKTEENHYKKEINKYNEQRINYIKENNLLRSMLYTHNEYYIKEKLIDALWGNNSNGLGYKTLNQ